MVCMKNRVAYIQYLHAKQAINPLWNKEIPAVWWQRVFSSCEYLHPQGHQHARWGRRWPCSDRRQNTSERSKVKKGHRVYTDNFYSKPTLAETLLQQKTILTGTVRANSKGIPEGCKVKLAVGQQASRRGKVSLSLRHFEKRSLRPNQFCCWALATMPPQKQLERDTKMCPSLTWYWTIISTWEGLMWVIRWCATK